MTEAISPTEELAIIRQINRFFLAVDQKAYDHIIDILGDRPTFNYSALGKSFPENVQAFIATLRHRHSPYERVQHITINHIVHVTKDQAETTANFVARHTLPPSPDRIVWTLGGRYTFRLSKISNVWRIDYCAIHPIWSDGAPVPVGTMGAE